MSAQEAPPVQDHRTSIRFSFNLSDLIKCRLWVLHHHKMLNGICIIGSLLVPLMDLNDSKLAEHTIGFRVLLFVSTALVALGFVVTLNIVLQIIMAVSSKNLGLVGVHEIEIGDDCLIEKTELNVSSHRWSGFYKLSESSNYLFIYVAENNVIYVPKRCFSSIQDASRFKQTIREKIGEL